MPCTSVLCLMAVLAAGTGGVDLPDDERLLFVPLTASTGSTSGRSAAEVADTKRGGWSCASYAGFGETSLCSCTSASAPPDRASGGFPSPPKGGIDPRRPSGWLLSSVFFLNIDERNTRKKIRIYQFLSRNSITLTYDHPFVVGSLPLPIELRICVSDSIFL